jgi:hypothetical protein
MMRNILLVALIFLSAAPVVAQENSDTLTLVERRKAESRKSPMGALLRSIAVPGWGQFYNGKYIKGTVVAVTETYFILRAAHWWKKAEDQYSLIQTLQENQRDAAFLTYENYRGSRNDFLWLTALTVFISMFDAYVDAHLSGFDVDLTPDFEDSNPQAKLTFTLRF